jgi:hypothetical protein
MKNITIAQAIVLVACMAAPLAAYKLFGNEGAYAATIAGMVLNFMLGRESAPVQPLRVLQGGKDDSAS